MKVEKLTSSYALLVIAAGTVCIGWAAVNIPVARVDLFFLTLFCLTIGIGSRITVKIPSLKSHIAVSDTFIFLALLLFGGELAITLAAVEAFFSSWRFCRKKITVFFNASLMALSTFAAVLVLQVLNLDAAGSTHLFDRSISDLIVALSAIAVTQFAVNTALASLHDSIKNGLPIIDNWKEKYIWAFITYVAGAASAGVFVWLSEWIGFGVIIAAFPVIYLLFLSYKMYLRNVEMSVQQAVEAERHARLLEERTVALRESEQRFRSAFNHAPIGIALVAPDGRWLRTNRALTNILGYTEAELRMTNFQSILFRDDLGITLAKIHDLAAGKIAGCQMEQRYLHKSGQTVWTSWSVSADTDVQTESSNLIFQLQDITDKKLAEQQLQHEATHDTLTNLPNRALFLSRLSEALNRSRESADYNVSVLFIDLDRFKNVNDSLGHLVGDELLVNISERLTECLRPSDLVARLGGDEFVILVEGHSSGTEVEAIAERVQDKFRMAFNLRGHEIYSSASIGILNASPQHRTAEDIMRDADTAMYQAKRAGKARHEVFDAEMHRAAMETLQLETDLRRAVENREILVDYQPIFSITTGEIESVEALARWEHPLLGRISPKKFIPLAEEIGLIDKLGTQVMHRACTEIGMLVNENGSSTRVKLSINLSCRQFARVDLAERIFETLGETSFPASRLKLEITESVFFEYHERAIEMLHRLKNRGIGIDIDDFGTGYSNLGYLVRLPISTLKIDKSFIEPITDDGANTEIVRTILALAANLNLDVVAEGVETQAQFDALKRLKCEGAQGFLLARPMSFGELGAYLSAGEVVRVRTQWDDLAMVSTLQ